MASTISDFRVGTSKDFTVTITLDGVVQDISSDTVTLRIKSSRGDTDANAKLTKAANVEAQGASGIAQFALNPSDTSSITPGSYHADVVWIPNGAADEYVLIDQTLQLLDRVSDA